MDVPAAGDGYFVAASVSLPVPPQPWLRLAHVHGYDGRDGSRARLRVLVETDDGVPGAPGETERDVSYLVAKPKVDLLLPLASAMPGGKAEAYGALSVVAQNRFRKLDA